jgi:hypothetical protein
MQGRPKRSLLRNVVLPARGKHIQVQRLCNELADSLDVAERLAGAVVG